MTGCIASRARLVRDELALCYGLSARDVGVCVERGISIVATIKTAKAAALGAKVEAALRAQRSVDYDKSSDEILAGGNVYTKIRYASDDVRDAARAAGCQS